MTHLRVLQERGFDLSKYSPERTIRSNADCPVSLLFGHFRAFFEFVRVQVHDDNWLLLDQKRLEVLFQAAPKRDQNLVS